MNLSIEILGISGDSVVFVHAAYMGFRVKKKIFNNFEKMDWKTCKFCFIGRIALIRLVIFHAECGSCHLVRQVLAQSRVEVLKVVKKKIKIIIILEYLDLPEDA